MATSVEQINAGLQRYYQLMGADYDDEFSTFCEDNGFDDMKEEMETTATDCMLLEFDENVPFKSEPDDKTQAIFDILLKIYNDPDCDFQEEDNEYPALQVNPEDLNVTAQDVKNIKDSHDLQLSTIWNSDMKRDKNILEMLAISRKVGAPYLLYLADLYNRDRISRFLARDANASAFTEMEWINKNKHCLELQRMSKKSVETVKHGILSFFHRIVPKLAVRSSSRIVDSLEDTVQYIKAQVDLVHKMANERGASCPFQVDAAIVYGDVRKEERKQTLKEEEDFDEEEDDDFSDDEFEKANKNEKFVDVFGNIKYRLKHKKLLHEIDVVQRRKGKKDEKSGKDDEKSSDDSTARIMRGYAQCFQQFQTNMIAKMGKKGAEYPRNHRFCSLIDRRLPSEQNKNYGVRKEDEIIFYEAPADCNKIPKNVVDLWYFDASRTCILPASDAKGGNLNINSAQAAMGALIVLSFHVLAADEIRAYLYWNGQVLRFFPQDVIDFFPLLFVDNKKNKAFKESAFAKQMVNEMKKKLRDKKFEAFYAKYRLSK